MLRSYGNLFFLFADQVDDEKMTTTTILEVLLRPLGLEKHIDILNHYTYESKAQLAELEAGDLVNMGIEAHSPDHKSLLAAIKSLNTEVIITTPSDITVELSSCTCQGIVKSAPDDLVFKVRGIHPTKHPFC